jgi:metal-responsive CopG/Arc/MetJ family transcriptional regulator
MKKRDIAEKIARARSQLFREAIANLIQAETGDPQIQAEERQLVEQLEDHADRWHRIADAQPLK